VNFLVRLRVTTHVTTAIVERLPIPLAEEAGPVFEDAGSIARALSQHHEPALEARLNAIVAKLYQLSEQEFGHVLQTFPLIPKEDRDRAMSEFVRL
jgi:hypothetical protein